MGTPYTRQELAVYERIRAKIVTTRIFVAAIIGVVAIGAKLLGVLNLTWPWTTTPLWGSAAYFVLALFHIAALRAANETKRD